MCLLIEGEYIVTGWGCCHCRTYNGLHRDECKFCGTVHCPVGTNDTPDVIEPRGDES